MKKQKRGGEKEKFVQLIRNFCSIPKPENASEDAVEMVDKYLV